MNYNKRDINIIQGDLLELYFILDNLTETQIEKVLFSCSEQNLTIECPYSALHEGYCLRLTSTLTKALAAQIGSYDLTVQFVDGNCFTMIHNAVFSVIDKTNRLSEVQ